MPRRPMPKWIFVHSDLDDAQLSAASFRVLAHLARRADGSGVAFPGVKSIGKVCRLNKDTVADSLKSLESQGWIARIKRPGCTSGYELVQLPPIRNQGAGAIRKGGVGAIRNEGMTRSEGYPSVSAEPTRNEGRHLSETKAPKVILEGDPVRESSDDAPGDGVTIASFPPAFRTASFSTAWDNWKGHLTRHDRWHRPPTPQTLREHRKRLIQIGSVRAEEAIGNAISKALPEPSLPFPRTSQESKRPPPQEKVPCNDNTQ